MKKLSLFITFVILLTSFSSCSENKNTESEYVPEFTLGETSDSVYTNSFSHIGFKPGSSWEFEKPNQYENSDVISDMKAVSGMDVAEVFYINVEDTETTARDYLKNSKKTLTDGWKHRKIYKKEFCGQQYVCFDSDYEYEKGKFHYMRQYARKTGDYIVLISIVATSHTPEQIQAMFYELT